MQDLTGTSSKPAAGVNQFLSKTNSDQYLLHRMSRSNIKADTVQFNCNELVLTKIPSSLECSTLTTNYTNIEDYIININGGQPHQGLYTGKKC